MNENVKALWTAALRSGRYKQGYNNLKKYQDGEACHCCLGVLCELAVAAGVTQEHRDNDGNIVFGTDGERMSSLFIPVEVTRWAELWGIDPATHTTINVGGEPKIIWGDTLSKLNDEDKLTFDQIAAVIETSV